MSNSTNPENPEIPKTSSPEIPNNPSDTATLQPQENSPNIPEIPNSPDTMEAPDPTTILSNLNDQTTCSSNTNECTEAEAARIDSFTGGEVLTQGTDETGGVQGGVIYLSKDDFFKVFCGAFGGLHMAIKYLKGYDLQSLPVDKADELAREASNAIYDFAVEYPNYLGWMISSGNETMVRLGAIGGFMAMKFMCVSAEIQVIRAEQAKDITPPAQEAKNGVPGYDFAPTDEEREKAA